MKLFERNRYGLKLYGKKPPILGKAEKEELLPLMEKVEKNLELDYKEEFKLHTYLRKIHLLRFNKLGQKVALKCKEYLKNSTYALQEKLKEDDKNVNTR